MCIPASPANPFHHQHVFDDGRQVAPLSRIVISRRDWLPSIRWCLFAGGARFGSADLFFFFFFAGPPLSPLTTATTTTPPRDKTNDRIVAWLMHLRRFLKVNKWPRNEGTRFKTSAASTQTHKKEVRRWVAVCGRVKVGVFAAFLGFLCVF